jgi:hypothetical protein
MREKFAAFKRRFALLNGFNKTSFFRQITDDRFLRQRIRVTTSLARQFRKLMLLLGSEMHFHKRSLSVHFPTVNGRQARLQHLHPDLFTNNT